MDSSALAVVGAGSFIGIFMLLAGGRDRIRKRLDEVAAVETGQFWARMANRPTGKLLVRLGTRARSSTAGRLRTRLANAGIYSYYAAGAFFAAKFITPAVLAAATFPAAAALGVARDRIPLLAVLMAAFGLIAPEFWLSRRIAHRQQGIRNALSDALDLLCICVEAGLGFEAALVRVSAELRDCYPVLSEEFRLANREVRTGSDRGQALRRMAERTGVEDLGALAARIVQTEKFGSSIAKSLRVHSDMLRTQRRQRAEEIAAKASIRLLFPLVFFIFPSMFVVILGPAALMMIDAFVGTLK